MSEKNKVLLSKDLLKEIFSTLEEVRAIETLEYQDKNYLSGNNESRSREKIASLTDVIDTLKSAVIGITS